MRRGLFIKKSVSSGAAAFCLLMVGYTLLVGMSVETFAAEAVSFGTCKVKVIKKAADMDTVSAGFTVEDLQIERNDPEWHKQYFKFTLPVKSKVFLTGCYTNDLNEGLQTHVTIYSDKNMTNKIGEYGWGYWEYDNTFSGKLKKGTYYCCIASKYANFDGFNGNINIIAGRIPKEDGVSAAVTTAKNKRTASITVKDKTLKSTGKIQYVKGNVRKADSAAWKKAKTVKLKSRKCSFKVKKNGTYTIRLQDAEGNWYLKKVKVRGIRK